MIKRISTLLLLAVIVLISVLLFNTFRFGKSIIAKQKTVSVPNASGDAARHLSEAIQIKTISFGDTLAIDTASFTRFRNFMESSYPMIHQKLDRQIFNEFSYVYTWKGKDTSLQPYVLMAHMDVVPVEAVAESKWTHPSFSGLILQDTIWGRGAVDDKSSLVGIMEAVEQLLKENHTPERTIYLCFGHDEEVSGKRGAGSFSKWFRERNIRPALVLDEGGRIDREHFERVKRPVAVIGTGEKGYVNIDLTVEIPGGHSSMPLTETAIDILNQAIVKIRASQMPALITPSIQELLNRTGPAEPFMNRMALSNLWLFNGMLVKELEKTKESNAMIHTTIVPTIVKAGIKDNVIPSIAKATLNSRILPGQTSEDVVNYVRKQVNDPRVIVKKQTISLMEPSPTSPFDGPAFKKLEKITYQMVPDVIVSPFLLIAATDSRYFRNFSDAVLNFSAMQDPKGFHGIDERIGVSDLNRMIFFYRMLITQ